MGKQLIISVLFLFLVNMMKNVESYKFWFDEKIKKGFEEMDQYRDLKDIESRKQARFGGEYLQYQSFKKYIDTSGKGDTLKNFLLVAPNDYYKENNLEIHFVEPAVVYLQSGLQNVTNFASPELIKKCNWAAVVENGAFNLIPITSDTQRNRLVDLYKNYKFTY